ncbi:RNA-directed DNA polymerase from mobile element jockey [Trichonephila inaurata madagascariensis]|uniref:RNA-directed DNA polymerase from mobile element jockey n=1 Tax=Trichonephila inaurata madagascariensis TaxID=2747483 RepID=A0A8X6XER3_9ARAC|nr:RNA-directed DNA polymerase from mobile element jockey [Trichonephila inaurata madagascariensis]
MIKLKFPNYLIILINSFLENRTFQIKIEATTSRIAHIEAGSPQGSNLSPILYNIFTQDFPTSPLVEIYLFADDAAILTKAATPENIRKRLQTYLCKLKKWLRLWRISINTGKSKAIIFRKGYSRKAPPPPLNLFQKPIAWCKSVDYLGVTLDNKLTFKNHLNRINCKFKNKLAMLHPLLGRKSKLTLGRKRTIYLQYLQPILICMRNLGHGSKYAFKETPVKSKRSAQENTRCSRVRPRRYLHKELKILPIKSRIKQLSSNFHSQVAGHSNPTIQTQANVAAQRRDTSKYPIESRKLRNDF